MSNPGPDHVVVETVVTAYPDCNSRGGGVYGESRFSLPPDGTRFVSVPPGASVCWRFAPAAMLLKHAEQRLARADPVDDPPPQEPFAFRALTREMQALSDAMTAAKNRQHALAATEPQIADDQALYDELVAAATAQPEGDPKPAGVPPAAPPEWNRIYVSPGELVDTSI
jgi:hypothetical protein